MLFIPILAFASFAAFADAQQQQQQQQQRRPMIHPGQCPRTLTQGPCLELCGDDGDCDRDSKCCGTGCGRICKKVNGIQGQGPFAAVERPPPLGVRQPFGGRNLTPQQQQQLLLQQQLPSQPSLVNIGGCSRGVSLRNADGSTLVCGFGPRDFACPPDFACTFDNSLRSLVCCPSGNSTKPSQEEQVQTNPCHEGAPISDQLGNRLKCDLEGGPANVCPSGTLCIVGACCPVSVAGLISVKPGKCPLPLPSAPGATCQNDCTFDADCPGPAKCCFVGCGAKCVASTTAAAPVQPPQNGNQQSGAGGPLSGNGASLSQFNLIQQQQRGQQQGFNNGQQFQFPNNGPPGTFGNVVPRGPPGQFPPQLQQQQRQFNNQRPQQPRPPQFQPLNSNRQFDQATE
jgi:hypothetical protein